MKRLATIGPVVVVLCMFFGCNSSSARKSGTIRGSSCVPKNLDVTKAEKEAKYYIYLTDASKQVDESPFRPILKVVSCDRNTLKGKDVSFGFE